MREHHTKEELTFLESRYPMITRRKQVVKYDPHLHEMEVGEAVFYLDGEPVEENIKRGVVEDVTHALPWNYALYFMVGDSETYYSCCLVWPDAEGQKELNLAKARKLIAENEG